MCSNRKDLWNKWQKWISSDALNYYTSDLPNLGLVDSSDEFLYDSRIKFGTSGVRELIGTGFALINHAVVLAITQGILAQLKAQAAERLKTHGVVIGYDGRKFSRAFAELAAAVFKSDAACGAVRLFSQVVPTPALAFATKRFECAIGVMITASHNSKEFNGYKVYDHTACFINPPLDKQILDSINEFIDDKNSPQAEAVAKIFNSSPTYPDPYEEVIDAFTKEVLEKCPKMPLADKKSNVGIAYTAMHGCGEAFVQRVMRDANFAQFFSVAEQAAPDEHFSTVRDPNPEVGHETFKMVLECAERNGCRVAFANDPDADRLGMAEQAENGEWRIFTGNEMAMLLIDYLVRRTPEADLARACIFFSTVSSSFARTLAKKRHFEIGETLTGFRFLGESMKRAKAEGKFSLLAFEESLGFLVADHVYDKCGVSSLLVFAEVAEECYAQNKSLAESLDALMQTNGYHVTYNKYYKVKDLSRLPAIFDAIRSRGAAKTLAAYPSRLSPKYSVRDVRDLTVGFDSHCENNAPTLPVSRSNQMITFYTEEDLVLTIRGSGTEPKLKFYAEKVYPGDVFQSGAFTDLPSLIADIRADCIEILDPLLKPDENGLSRSF